MFAAARSADGRGRRTVLADTVPAHFALSDPLELARAVHVGQIPEARLGELARVVIAASDEDSVAAGIVGRLADEVTAFARAALRRLELTGEDPDVILGGRLLRALPPEVIETIAQGIGPVAPNARVFVTSSEPIVGAALLGLDALGADTSAITRARAELDAAVASLEPGVLESTTSSLQAL
jgi:N-acetylglucosamine kinase-like BadF-type ATPase